MILLLLLLLSVNVAAQSPSDILSKVRPSIQKGTIWIAKDGMPIQQYSSHPQHASWTPASLLKLVTALASLHHLKKDFHFKTQFFQTPQNDLVIKGHGDPFLVSEEWQQIAKVLSQHSQSPSMWRHLYLDTQTFDPNIQIPGQSQSANPYDAHVGALVTNFNTIYLHKSSSGKVTSAEPQTPLVPMAQKLGVSLSVGKHRINLSFPPQQSLQYTAEVFQAFFEKEGRAFKGNVIYGPPTNQGRLIYEHEQSRPLSEILKGMLVYSNNFIANQLLLVLGKEVYGAPATLEKGVRVLELFLQEQLGLSKSQFVLQEGSGLGHQSQFTPEAFMQIMEAFAPFYEWLPQHSEAFVKTGTLTGVYNVAAYFPHRGHLWYILIMLEQSRNTRLTILDQVLSNLTTQ